jgi:hypothetical protein
MSDGSKMLILRGINKLFVRVTRVWLEVFPSSQFLVVQPTFQPGELKDIDLRCFIIPNQDEPNSVVRRLRGNVRLGRGGSTAQTDQGTVSEVYDDVFGADVDGECEVIFHELMHNKLEMGDEMHTDGNVGFGIASASVEDGKTLGRRSLAMNGTNELAMAKALLKPVRQYRGA